MTEENKQVQPSGFNAPVKLDAANETNVAKASATAFAEIQAGMILARQYPRDEAVAWQKFTTALTREKMAERAIYSYPRGGTVIKGGSVHMAKLAASYWGNIWSGFEITRVTNDTIDIMGYAWDLETGRRATKPATIKKLIQRKDKQSGVTKWKEPDERDLRELVNKQGAICERNALFDVMPSDFRDDGMKYAENTLKGLYSNINEKKKKILKAFEALGVTAKMLEYYVDKEQWTEDDLVELTGIGNAIKEGEDPATYFAMKKEKPAPATFDLKGATMGDPKNHQGYEPKKAEPGPEPVPPPPQEPGPAKPTKRELFEKMPSDSLVHLISVKMAEVFADDTDAGNNFLEGAVGNGTIKPIAFEDQEHEALVNFALSLDAYANKDQGGTEPESKDSSPPDMKSMAQDSPKNETAEPKTETGQSAIEWPE